MIDALLADLEFDDVESRAADQDLVEDLRQDERIDDVAAQLDRLGYHPVIVGKRLTARNYRARNAATIGCANVSEPSPPERVSLLDNASCQAPSAKWPAC